MWIENASAQRPELVQMLLVAATETTLPEDIAIFAHSLERVIHA